MAPCSVLALIRRKKKKPNEKKARKGNRRTQELTPESAPQKITISYTLNIP
jgi:hypothetical protein